MTKVEVENVNHPGQVTKVDGAKYAAMREAVMTVAPEGPPGMTPEEIIAAVKGRLPEDLFPGQEKAGWWVKCVQLDLEAKGLLRRADKGKVRLWRQPGG